MPDPAPVAQGALFPFAKGAEPVTRRRDFRSAVPVIAPALTRSSVARAPSGLGANVVDVYRGTLRSVDPFVAPQYLTLLYVLAIMHPAVRQAVQLFIANTNRGHSIGIDVPDGADALAQAAEDRINAFSARVYPRGGLDGLFNAQIAQIAISGALSCEDVIRPGRHVERIVSVPVQDIVFHVPDDAEDGDWHPYQRARGVSDIRLDERTYGYLALQTIDNNPYAIPPFAAAINSILEQIDTSDQRRAILEKVGYLGMLSLQVPLRKGIDDGDAVGNGDADEQFRERQRYLREIADAFAGDYRKGMAIFDEGMTLAFQASPGGSIAGAADLYQQIEAEMFSGLLLDPSLFGRSWAKTETWLGVAKSLLESMAESMQRLLGTSMQKTLATEFALGRIPLSPYVNFTPLPTMQPAAKAAADWQTYQTVRTKVRDGYYTPDEGAQELGRERWEDPDRLFSQAAPQPFAPQFGKRFRFDKARGRYVFDRPRIVSGTRLTARKSRRKRLAPAPSDAVLQRLVERFAARYAGKVGPALGEVQDALLEQVRRDIANAPEGTWRDGDEFTSWATDRLTAAFRTAWDGKADDVLSRVLETHEEMAAAWRKEQAARRAAEDVAEVSPELTAQDVSALAGSDIFHMSIYARDLSSEDRTTLQRLISEQVEQSGKDITDPDVLDEWISRMDQSGGLLLRRRDHGREGGEASETEDEALDRMGYRIRRIVDTTVVRSRSVQDIRLLSDMGVREYRIERHGSEDCPICGPMEGTVVSVQDAVQYVDDFLAMTPEEQERHLNEQRQLSADELAAVPGIHPPFHPNCVCALEANE